MNRSNELRRSFHGTGIKVTGSAAIISALERRLGELGREDTQYSLTFEYEIALNGKHAVEKPRGNGRPFYIPSEGEAIYFADPDVLYMSYGQRAKVLCEASEGRCRISLSEPEAENLWLGTHPLFTIPFLEMCKRRGRYSLHAAAFASGESCVLLAGTSGVGKSTLTLCHLRAGMSFMGDDMTFFEDRAPIRALAFPEPIDITDATAAFFPELQALATSVRQPGWPKHEIRPSDFFGCDLTKSAIPVGIVFPQISSLEESQMIGMGSNEAFMELLPNVLLTDSKATEGHVNFISRLVQSIPAYRLHAARDFGRIAELVRGTLIPHTA